MSTKKPVTIFGEVLFDCFPGGEQKLGGAPFNVAWHLQALGDEPAFISRIGEDDLGKLIEADMQDWGMDDALVQHDPDHPTGRVNITISNDEPSYDIALGSAWDYIDSPPLAALPTRGLFYHGSLAGRSDTSYDTLQKLTENPDYDIFVDVNLRQPWWQKQTLYGWLEQARWVKLNQDELAELGFRSADLHQDITRMHTHFHLDQLIVTCGDEGAIVRDNDGEIHLVKPSASTEVVDTVGAGDAFTAMYIHGLLHDWDIDTALHRAQTFASRVVGQRGAIGKDKNLYNINS
jgi:fructokinase